MDTWQRAHNFLVPSMLIYLVKNVYVLCVPLCIQVIMHYKSNEYKSFVYLDYISFIRVCGWQRHVASLESDKGRQI